MNIAVIIITLLIPPLGIPLGLLGLVCDNRKYMSYIFCIAFAFAALAYSYQAISPTDITRYWAIAEDDGALSFFDMLQSGYYGTKVGEYQWIINSLFWFSGRIGLPRLAPAVSTFFVYYISFYITNRVGEDYKASNKVILVCMLFSIFTLNFYSIANNVRNVFAFQLAGLGVFRDIYEKKRNILTYALYVIPIFIHTSAMLLIAIRVTLPIIRKFKLVGFIGVLLVNPVIDFLFPYTKRMTGSFAILAKIISKANSYFNDIGTVWGMEVQASGSERAFKLLYVSIVLIILFLCYYGEKKDKRWSLGEYALTDARLNTFINYMYFVGLIAIACVPMLRPEYWRFTAALVALSGGMFVRNIYKPKNDRVEVTLFMVAFAFGILCCALWIRNMLIYADGIGTLSQSFFASPLIILVSAI